MRRPACAAVFALALLPGCNVLLGIGSPGAAGDDDDAGDPDAAGAADAASEPIDADVVDATPPPDARGNPVTILQPGQNLPRMLALDLNSVYWANMDGPIFRIGKDGSAPSMLVDGPSFAEGLMEVHNGFLYWSTREGQFRLNRASLGGGGAFVRIVGALGSPYVWAVDADGIHFSNGLNVFHAEADGTMQTLIWPVPTDPGQGKKCGKQMYWSTYGDVTGTITTVDVTTGVAMIIAQGLNGPTQVACDGARVYWANLGMMDPAGGGGILEHTGSVMSQLPDGSDLKVIASGQTMPNAIAIDDTHVYWYSWDEIGLVRAPKAGGGPIEFVAMIPHPQVMRVDDTSVYFGGDVAVGKTKKSP